MNQRRITSTDVHWIAKNLSKQSEIVKNLEILAGELGLSLAELEVIKKKDRVEGINAYNFIKMILEIWIENVGATIEKLEQALRTLRWNSAADDLRKESNGRVEGLVQMSSVVPGRLNESASELLERRREYVKGHIADLVATTGNWSVLKQQLVQNFLLDTPQVQSIDNRYHNNPDRFFEMYVDVMTKPLFWDALITSLKKSSNSGAADILEKFV